MIDSVPTNDASLFAAAQALGLTTARPAPQRPRGTRREPPPSIEAAVQYPRLVQLHTRPNRRARRAAMSSALSAQPSTPATRAAAAALRIRAFLQRSEPPAPTAAVES